MSRPVAKPGRLRRFCQEGPNRGKPGPCPESKQTAPAARPQSKAAAAPAAHVDPVAISPKHPLARLLLRSAMAPAAAAGRLAQKLGRATWDHLPPAAQQKLTTAYRVGKVLEHRVMVGFRKGKELAEQVARERGLSPEHVERVGKILGTADLISAWTVNFPVVTAATGNPIAGKASSWIPVASLAYSAYSGARNPFALIRAARKVLSGKTAATHHAEGRKAAVAALLAAYAAAQNPDWLEALAASALDQTHDLSQAVPLAVDALKSHPHLPNDGATKHSEGPVPARIQKAIADLPVSDPGYGYVMWEPSSGRAHVVLGDGDEQDAYDQWMTAVRKVPGVKKVSADAESWPKGDWLKITRKGQPRQVSKHSEGSSALHGVEIFAAGTHRGKTYTTRDLDDMVRNFRRASMGQKPGFRVPLVIGHEEDQDFLERSDLPAAGWADRVWREGDTLKADFEDVPPKVAQLLRGKTYRTVSSEVYDDPPEGLKGCRGKMLRRVALLGGDIPQVKTLDDIPAPEPHREFASHTRVLLRMARTRPSRRAGAFWVFSEVSRMAESDFAKLEHSLAHRKGVDDPRALAAAIGDRKLGKEEMARRSAAAREHDEDEDGGDYPMDRNDMLQALGEHGVDVATLEEVPDPALAEMLRVCEDKDAEREGTRASGDYDDDDSDQDRDQQHPDENEGDMNNDVSTETGMGDQDHDRDQDAGQYDEGDLPEPKDPEEAKAMAERYRKMKAYAEAGLKKCSSCDMEQHDEQDGDEDGSSSCDMEQHDEQDGDEDGSSSYDEDGDHDDDHDADDHAEDDVRPTPATVPMKKPAAAMSARKHSEAAQERLVERIVDKVINARVGKQLARFQKFTESSIRSQKKQAVSDFCKEMVKAGKLTPAEIDRKDPANVFNRLMRADDTVTVARFSEKGKERKMTDFDLQKREIERRRPFTFSERARSAGTVAGKRDDTEESARVRSTFEAFREKFPKGTDVETLIKGFEVERKHNPELTAREFMEGMAG